MNPGWLLMALMLWGVASATDTEAEKNWWQKRQQRPDIFYPHNAHLEVMARQGDSCFLCHPFSPNRLTDPDRVKQLSVIANEPLRAICHDCHVTKLTAPWRCSLCHDDPRKIWPPDHDRDYRNHHAAAARQGSGQCRSCHIDLSFCTDCHLHRERGVERVHDLGYGVRHGLDARIGAAACGRCHNASYCQDCHRRRGR